MGHQKLTIAVSLADYCFERTRTIGQMNLAIGLVKALATRPEIEKLVVLKNNTIQFDFHQENLVFIDCNQAIAYFLGSDWFIFGCKKTWRSMVNFAKGVCFFCKKTAIKACGIYSRCGP